MLHGHTHDGKVDWLSPSLPVLSTGSAGLDRDARPEEVPNQYQAIRIHGTGIERWARRYEPGRRRWIADTGSVADGNEWHTTTAGRVRVRATPRSGASLTLSRAARGR